MDKIVVVAKPNCTECERIETSLDNMGIEFLVENLPDLPVPRQFELRNVAKKARQMSMPIILVNDEFMTTRDFEEKYLRQGE